ncbi:VOC family protein [Terriglobus saanensis]|uniref:Glyoxalase family protein n=1 Tax=Terriglobus saanensis (strain ATCC BAA-1853 / DSM 23119 / SP1PR4) TaxID=401053 RepID=E8UY35_TERSS|nr:VOC family protein [Terriglobus saanensis]ADV84269.1 glyoxalase family protein [Terriglobus saanensis SP1PR4]
MDLQFDHLGLVTSDLVTARAHLSITLGIQAWSQVFDDPGIGVSVQFGIGNNGSPVFELIAPLGETSPVAQALKQSRNILNHIAYLVPNLESAADHLRTQGCFPTGDPMPAVAYGGQRVQFFLSPLRFMMELIEAPAHQHRFFE